ncbi:serine hydroxymethyltransferase [Sporomusa termitida]|uniref:2-methylserine hydroxymethyltransferase n=1 Tax=Sporomusa termitida TaxID=2377 RepID=A0A517DWT5_9FIRM|nr:serine hydroxymethyltransferase [Sporomusa termitida]QDR81716.1 Serine hydroxymethyltransferase [Sporomusa termitida]
MLSKLTVVDRELADQLHNELIRQNMTIELIASENFVPPVILEAQGSILTNKYAEGYPGRRYHAGCEHIDVIETLAIERAKTLFGAEYANVQPHSGVNANLGVYFAVLKPGDTILGMSIDHGGHLSHGTKMSISGRFYKSFAYGVTQDTEVIDYDQVRSLAKQHSPQLIVAGASAYSRQIDYAAFRNIADEVGAYLLVDMAHIAGLVAAKLLPSPVPYADFVTFTTTKTMRGARGGMIVARQEFGDKIDKALFPGIQGGHILQAVAAKALCFKLAMTDDFIAYQQQIVKNSQLLCRTLQKSGFRIVAGGTDNHLFLVDLEGMLTGKAAEERLAAIGIMVNKNLIPYDSRPPVHASGIRLGTAAMTARGSKEDAMEEIGNIIARVLTNGQDESVLADAKNRVREFCLHYPLYLTTTELRAAVGD